MPVPWLFLSLLVGLSAPTAEPEPIHRGRPLTAWVRDLIGPDSVARSEAREALTHLSPQLRSVVLDHLLAALDQRDRNTRPVVGAALLAQGYATLPRLWEALQHPNESRRAGAAHALGQWAEDNLIRVEGDGRRQWRPAWGAGPLAGVWSKVIFEAAMEISVRRLAGVLQDRSAEVRLEAVWALRWFGPQARPAARAVLRALAEGDYQMRYWAPWTLVDLAAPPEWVVPALGLLLDDAEQVANATRALSALGPPGRERLQQGLSDPRTAVRAASAEALGSMESRGRQAIPPLLRALQDPDASVRGAAANALAAIGPWSPEIVPALESALWKPGTADSAAQALCALGDAARPALPELVRRLRRELEPRRFRPKRRNPSGQLFTLSHCEDLAIRFGVEAAPLVGPLVYQLQRPGNNPEMILGALGHIGPPGAPAVPVLRRLWATAEPKVRRSMVYTLGAIGPAAWEAVPELRQALRDKDPYLRRAAADSLGAIGPKAAEAVPDLIRGLQTGKEAKEPLPFIHALRQIGPGATAALPALRAALTDTDQEVRIAAGWAIWQIEGQQAILLQELRAVFSNLYPPYLPAALAALNALEADGQPFVPLLHQLLQHDEEEVRREVALVLWRREHRPEPVLPVLVAAAAGEDGDVRVARVLGEIGPPARAAAPALAAHLERTWSQEHAAALKRIDPAAARKLGLP